MDSKLVWEFGYMLDYFVALFYDNVQNIFNFSILFLGFGGFIYWMIKQNKYNKEAANNSSQIK